MRWDGTLHQTGVISSHSLENYTRGRGFILQARRKHSQTRKWEAPWNLRNGTSNRSELNLEHIHNSPYCIVVHFLGGVQAENAAGYNIMEGNCFACSIWCKCQARIIKSRDLASRSDWLFRWLTARTLTECWKNELSES